MDDLVDQLMSKLPDEHVPQAPPHRSAIDDRQFSSGVLVLAAFVMALSAFVFQFDRQQAVWWVVCAFTLAFVGAWLSDRHTIQPDAALGESDTR